MQQRLATYRRPFVDVSEGDAASDELMAILGMRALPKVLIFTDAGSLTTFLGGQGEMPEPPVAFDNAVAPDDFLSRIPR